MLSVEAARKIGIDACIDKIGRDFVLEHKDFATAAYGESEDGVFCFVGVDGKYQTANRDGVLVLDSRSEFPYRASCNVSLADGATSFIECVVPRPGCTQLAPTPVIRGEAAKAVYRDMQRMPTDRAKAGAQILADKFEQAVR